MTVSSFSKFNNILVAILQTNYGRVGVAIWAGSLLYIMHSPYWMFESFAICIIGLLPTKRRVLIAFFSVFYLLFIDHFEIFLGPSHILETLSIFDHFSAPSIVLKSS